MELEQTCKKNNDILPADIIKNAGLSTGLGWDNFDLNIETPSGAGTIHHTHGICYQNSDSNAEKQQSKSGRSNVARHERKASKEVLQSTKYSPRRSYTIHDAKIFWIYLY